MNKLNLFSSTLVLPCLLMSGAAFSAEANNELYASMHKQLSIMSDIIKSSVADKSQSQVSKINRIDSTYLSGQGIVFTISSASNNSQWGNYSFNFSMPAIPEIPVAPIASEVNQDFRAEYDFDINETVTHAMASAGVGFERVVERFEQSHERSRELRDEQRDLTYSLRDVEREKRDITYQLSRASKEHKTELKQALDKLTKQEESLLSQQRKLTQLISAAAAEQQAEQKQRAQERANYYQQLTVKLTETLCLYGNGLKALPKNEYVSVILKSAGDKSASRYKDSILVFAKQDIASCSADKISAATLISKSQTYQF